MTGISVTLHTTEYRGDHSAEVTLAYESLLDETVEGLIERLPITKFDWIELRRVN